MKNLDERTEEAVSLKLFVVLFRTWAAIQKKVEENIRGLNLNPTEFAVLEFIYSRGEQPIQKIGEKVLISSSSITYVVDKLVQKQLMERKPCAHDRRITYAALTVKGNALMQESFPIHRKAIHDILGGLELEEKKHMIDQLKKLGYYAEENH